MTKVLNPSFETIGTQPGLAESWTFTTSVAAEEWAGFSGYCPPCLPAIMGQECFDWFLDTSAFTDDNLEAFSGSPDGFEHDWQNNTYQFELNPAIVVYAGFVGSLTYEGFEVGWDNDDYFWDWGDVTYATAEFDTALESHEDFEEEWRDNENFMWDWGDVTPDIAYFDTTLEPYEDFEEEWP